MSGRNLQRGVIRIEVALRDIADAVGQRYPQLITPAGFDAGQLERHRGAQVRTRAVIAATAEGVVRQVVLVVPVVEDETGVRGRDSAIAEELPATGRPCA